MEHSDEWGLWARGRWATALRTCSRAPDSTWCCAMWSSGFWIARWRRSGKNLDREVAKSKITAADKDSALGRIQSATDRGELADCDFVVEAATEKFEIKTEIFRDLDRLDSAGNHSGFEYFFDFDHQAGGG